MRRTIAVPALVLTACFALGTSTAQAQFRYPPIYYPAYRYAEPESDLRINVKPREASVYVDGYFAGSVDKFDGAFQRLHVAPGQHEIVVYLEGYRSIRQRLYLSANTTRKVEGALERLSPGEPLEPPPTPSVDVERRPMGPARQPPFRGIAPRRPQPRPIDPGDPGDLGVPDDRRPPPNDPRDPDDRGDRRGPAPTPLNGTLSIQVQPGGATVLIDGERWSGPSDNERLIVQVPEGRHRVEVERNGYERFDTEIDVRRGETSPVNISLNRNR